MFVCVRACVRACARILHIVMLEPLLVCTLCVSFGKIADNIFHFDVHYSYVLCLFNALGLEVGALQISIIIIIRLLKRL